MFNVFFFFKQKTAYEMRISDWSSDVCSSDLDWPKNKLLALAYHDVEDSNPDQTFVSVSTEHLVQQFAWLRENGYQPVTVDQILEANRGGKPLPDKAL